MQEQVYTVKVTADKTQWFNEKGQLHRVDGPAVEGANGTKHWYQKDQLHRIDGPAVEWASGTKHWYINSQELTVAEFLAKTQPKELTIDEIAQKFGIPVE
jgi:uncharacterized protein (UPF0216 family)